MATPPPRLTPAPDELFDLSDRFPLIAPRSLMRNDSDPPTSLVRQDAYIELPPGSVVGEIYEIDAKLGAGGMGEVYAARHMKLGKRVAIKVIKAQLSEDIGAIERFAQEARTLAHIQHPAIVAVEHVGELADGRAYFVMEYLRGESLFERLQRGPVPLAEALRVLDQMARGLEAAHARGVVHRDLKPENIYLVHLPEEAPTVKLLDFGLAKLATEGAARTTPTGATQSGMAIGTPSYMAPEQMRGSSVDHRADIYALGCVAYELLLGQAPFPRARTVPELYAAHLHESPPLPRTIWQGIPAQLDLMLFAMLAKDPNRRPTLAQVRSILSVVAANRPKKREVAATLLVGPRTRRSKPFIIAGALIGILGGILLARMISSRGETGSTLPVETGSAVPAAKAAKTTAPIDAPPPTPKVLTPSLPPARPAPSKAPSVSKAAAPSHPNGSSTIPSSHIPDDTRKEPPSTIPPTPPTPTPTPPTPPRSSKPTSLEQPTTIDKNQTINPFAKKRERLRP